MSERQEHEPMSPGKNCSIVFTKLLNNLSICEREIRDLTRVSDLLKWEFGKLGQNCSIKSPNFESNFSPNVNSTALATARCSSMALESIIEKCSNNKVQMEEGIDLLKKTLSRTKCLCGVDCPVAGNSTPVPTGQPNGSFAQNQNAAEEDQLKFNINSGQLQNGNTDLVSVQRVQSRITDAIRKKLPTSGQTNGPAAPDAVMESLPYAPEAVIAGGSNEDFDQIASHSLGPGSKARRTSWWLKL